MAASFTVSYKTKNSTVRTETRIFSWQVRSCSYQFQRNIAVLHAFGENGKSIPAANASRENIPVKLTLIVVFQSSTKPINVPPAANVSGICGPKLSSMIFTWNNNATAARKNSVEFYFKKEEKSTFIDVLNVNIFLDEGNFPDAAGTCTVFCDINAGTTGLQSLSKYGVRYSWLLLIEIDFGKIEFFFIAKHLKRKFEKLLIRNRLRFEQLCSERHFSQSLKT